jgi:hypothetical protein
MSTSVISFSDEAKQLSECIGGTFNSKHASPLICRRKVQSLVRPALKEKNNTAFSAGGTGGREPESLAV